MIKLYAASFLIGFVIGLGSMFGPSFVSGGLFKPPTEQEFLFGWVISIGILVVYVKYIRREVFKQQKKLLLLALINSVGFLSAIVILVWSVRSAIQSWKIVL